jgi:hypothetical protein
MNVHCPFHDDNHPSASLHFEKGLYCHTSGDWYTWNEVGVKIGLGKIHEWQRNKTSNHISTELREALIKAGHTNLSRLLDVFYLLGWLPGKEFSRKEVYANINNILSTKTIRNATDQLGNYCPFIPPFSLQLNQKEKKGKKSRPPKIFMVPDANEISMKLGVQQKNFEIMDPSKIRSVSNYRAEVYAALPNRKPGMYSRKLLASRIGVSIRTSRNYDKKAGLKVTPNITRNEMTIDDLLQLPEKLFEKRDYRTWLQDERNQKYPPIKRSIEMIAKNGGGKVYRCVQLANSYEAGNG